jgi:heme-binding HmuY-like protein
MLWSKMRGLILVWIISLILVGCGSGTVTSHDPTSSTYQPTPPQPQEVGARLVGPIVYTVDARSSDVWMYFDFARSSVVTVQEPKTEAWDLAFKRYVIKTNGGETNSAGQGALLSMKERDFAAITTVPEKAEFIRDVHPKNRPSSYNPVIEKWFDYSYLANVLVPKPLVYLVRTHDGKYVKLQILSYYCANKSAGCLTFEYVYQGDGSPRLAAPSASGA